MATAMTQGSDADLLAHMERVKERAVQAEDMVDGYFEEYCRWAHAGTAPWEEQELYTRLTGFLERRLEAVIERRGKAKAATVIWWTGLLIQGLITNVGDAQQVAALLKGTRHDHQD
ncbi:unnamed protein product [Tilletia controversa]|uniref:Uncharacterized protein n=1 Tax=Tilletia controversa TaxID=13291 RepID=A0A8X7STZ7_9BASI|nr:hypothetical protein CF328_g6728 [Tilletia controversa]KAE8241268.1 hypothetical protein A4X06_0g7597 [Tilletia controversa]CAD6947379.1 unnamed protein product [Tilletia controversa]CAD6986145.1 unnamed protein product [Tilletia controversa]